MNWSPQVCKFSPLRTPHVKAAKEKLARLKGSPKLKKAQESIVSDVESVTSVITQDIRALARTVQERMGQRDTLDSEEDLFITQSSQKKGSKKSKIEEVKNSATKTTKMNEAEHDMDSDQDLFITQSFKKESHSMKTEKGKNSGMKTTKKKEPDSEMDSDSSSLLTDSESEKETVTDTKNKPTKPAKITRSADFDTPESASEEETTQKSKTVAVGAKSPKLPESQHSENAVGAMRFDIPQHFEMKPVDDIVHRSSLEGKQIWLISAPDNFDISTLDGQTLNLDGKNLIYAKDESERTWEVASFPNCQDPLQTTSLCTVGADNKDSNSLVIGPEVSGQLLVMDWIPTIPPLQLMKRPHVKHSVPDNLKPSYTPFGAETPHRYQSTPGKRQKAKKRHKEKQGSLTEEATCKKAKLLDSAVDVDNQEKAEKKQKKRTTIDSKKYNKISAIKTEETQSSLSESLVSMDKDTSVDIQTEGQKQAKKKKKKRNTQEGLEETEKTNIDASTDLTGFVSNSVVPTESAEKIKKKKHKKHDITGNTNDDTNSTEGMICDNIDTTVSEEETKKKKKKHKRHGTETDGIAGTETMLCDSIGTLEVQTKEKKKKKHKNHEVVDRSADDSQDVVKGGNSKHQATDIVNGENAESSKKNKKKKKKHKA